MATTLADLNAWRGVFRERGPSGLPPRLVDDTSTSNEVSPGDGPAWVEIAGYRALASGRPGEGHARFEKAAAVYAQAGADTDASLATAAASSVRKTLFPHYDDDEELLADVRLWARARLTDRYSTDVGEPAGERPEEDLTELWSRWVLRLRESHRNGQDLRIVALVRRLRLRPEDELWLIVLLAVESDPVFQALRRHWVNNDGFYAVSLLLDLLADEEPERSRFLARLDTWAPMVRLGLVTLNAPSARPGTGLANHFIELNESVIAFVTGRAYWPPSIDAFTHLYSPEVRPGEAYFEPKLERLDRAVTSPQVQDDGAFVALCGTTRETNLALAQSWAAREDRPVIEISADRMFDDPLGFETAFWEVVRESMLRDAVVFVDGDRRWDEPQRTAAQMLRTIARSVAHYGRPILFDAPIEGDENLAHTLHPLFQLRILPPTLDEQVVMWQEALEAEGVKPLTERTLRTKVCDMALSIEDVHRTVRLAVNSAYLSAPDDDDGRPEVRQVTPEALRALATSKLNRGMYAVADRVSTSLTWNDVILPDKIFEQLMEIVTYARYQRQVFEDWGFGPKMPYGRANSSMFSGPPGTGKTMVAGVIARELGMDLFRIETSKVVSKYIGETEKNLAKVFDEAARSHAILLFDEADALFAKRTDVKSSHDRYANLEVNYLLQRIEQFDGITMLTTNYPENIDQAFARRIRFKVEFPVPTEQERTQLWKLMLPADAKRAADIDFEVLGKSFDFVPANIKDAVLRAAFRAVESDRVIDHALLEETGIAVAREQGRLLRVRDGCISMSH